MQRRTFLQLSSALAATVGLVSLPSVVAERTKRRTPRRLLLVFAVGGWDTTFALDPKEPPHADPPKGKRELFEGLDVFVDPSRRNVTRFFERHAAVTSIVRGISTDAINHAECQRRIATGTREETRPDLGAIIGHELGAALPLPYLVLGDVAFTGPYAASAARMGTTNQIVELLDPAVAPNPTLATERALLADYAAASAARARATRGTTGYNRRRVDDFAASFARGDRLAGMRDRFGGRGAALSFEIQIPIAIDAIEQDLSQAVMLSTQYEWDTHTDNPRQAGFHDDLFAALTQIVDELVRRPGRSSGRRMLDETTVVVISEMARGLKGGLVEHEGKDHWPVTSAMVIGAGVEGGRVIGQTTPDGHSVAIDLATGAPSLGGTKPMYSHFGAGVLSLCGVDPSPYFSTPVFDAFAV